MTEAHDLLRAVDLKPHFESLPIEFNKYLGFMEVSPEDPKENTRRLVGFATPFDPKGGINPNNSVTPITEYADLPEDARSIDKQGKGVGPRLYNVREAFGGSKERPPFIGLYMLDVRVDHIVDMRQSQGSSIGQIMRHAGRIVRSVVVGEDAVVQDIHAEYNARNTNEDLLDAVLYNVPPHPALRQRAHRVETPDGLVPKFLIIRNPAIEMTRLGTATSPW